MLKRIKVGELIREKKAHSQTGPFGTQLKASEYVDVGIPVINVRNIGMGDVRSDNLEYLNDSKALELKSHRLKKDDIVFGRKGAVERHSFITENEDGWIQGSDCIRLRILTDDFNPKFISYFFRTQAHQQWMINLGSFGATMGSLNQEIISRIEIPDIPPSKQDEIASILSAYDDLIENNNQRIKMLEEMAEEIYKEWFVRMRFPATADTPGYQDCKFFDQEGNEVAYGTVGALPEGWEEVELENIVQVSDGTHDSPKRTNKGHYLVTGKNIKNRFIDTSGCYHISSEDHQKIQKRSYLNIGDVIVSNIGTVGNLAYIFEKPDYSVKNVIILRALNRDHSSYIFQFMESENTQATFQNEMTGASQQFLSLSYMRKLKVLKPHEQVLKAFDVYVSQILKLTFFLYKKNQVLQETRDLLLPRLINGKLDVSKLSLSKYDNDNPENLSMAAEPEGTYHAFNESDK